MTGINHLSLPELEAGLEHIRQSPKDHGGLEMIVRRPRVEEREVLTVAELDLRQGLVGDTWGIRPSTRTADRGPHPDMQLNIMNARAIALVAGHRRAGRWPATSCTWIWISVTTTCRRAHDWRSARRSSKSPRSLTRAARNSGLALGPTP